jgi:FkbM family methyltransferase
MLIKLSEAIKKYNLKISGVIHVGAHHGQEYEEYKTCGIRDIVFIEPCTIAFSVLRKKFSGNGVKLYNVALGSSEGFAIMNVETANSGQSNSLLKPAKHLKQYPSIRFTQTEKVRLTKLDTLNLEGYNMINMDVQGYELEVLKGSIKTLEHIDIIYTEVNRDELYEGCARVEQLDQFLTDFKRVHTDWGGGTWGDAIYVRTRKAIKSELPAEFRPRIKFPYPDDNHTIFEEWFFQQAIPKTERVYLPVFWTSYYVNHSYGKDKVAIKRLQDYINSLDRSKKYYTICQYDDGVLNDLSGLDIKIFGMSGEYDYPLPLLCQPHRFTFRQSRNLFANFIGRNTHPIRKPLFDLKGRGYLISDKRHSLQAFCDILSRSTFTLCPRGYGATSFRIQEAIQYGSIPVYISDEFIFPHNLMFENYGVVIKEEEVGKIDEILRSIPPAEIQRKQAILPAMFKNYFTYEANRKIILENIF